MLFVSLVCWRSISHNLYRTLYPSNVHIGIAPWLYYENLLIAYSHHVHCATNGIYRTGQRTCTSPRRSLKIRHSAEGCKQTQSIMKTKTPIKISFLRHTATTVQNMYHLCTRLKVTRWPTPPTCIWKWDFQCISCKLWIFPRVCFVSVCCSLLRVAKKLHAVRMSVILTGWLCPPRHHRWQI